MPPNRDDAFGSVLRRFRVRAGLSQEELAEQAGVSPRAIGTLEQGRSRRPHPHTLDALARALGLASAERDALLRATAPPASVGPVPSPAISTSTPSVGTRPLPEPLTPLIGREADVAAVVAVLGQQSPRVRLLTLVGPGGVGKTRLALAVARAVAASLVAAYPDGVVFVDLAPLRDDWLVAATIARTLDLRDSHAHTAHDLLLDWLRERQCLLVLDNFEHLVAAASLLSELLASCPNLALLVTSRSPLRLRAEQRFMVGPLVTPTAADESSLLALAASPAVQLFVERAQQVAPSFDLDAATAPLVAAICRRLEGLPLAIELAAARAGLLHPTEMLRRLDRRLSFLTAGAADVPGRQRTLRHTLAWSHALLGPGEQVLFRRLAAFAVGWTLEAAEAVVAVDGDDELSAEAVVEQLTRLLENNLVRRIDARTDQPRFGMLETIREYADEQLRDTGEAELIGARHRDWCLDLVRASPPEALDPERIERLECEQDNLRCPAMDHCARRGRGGSAVGLGWWPLWYRRGHLAEGFFWLRELADCPPRRPFRRCAHAHSSMLRTLLPVVAISAPPSPSSAKACGCPNRPATSWDCRAVLCSWAISSMRAATCRKPWSSSNARSRWGTPTTYGRGKRRL